MPLEKIDIPLKIPNDKPTNNNETHVINNIKVKYIGTKTNKFNKDISYFKITNETKQILRYLNSDLTSPFWLGDDGLILKCNKKFVPDSINTTGQLYEVIIEMNYYEMEKEGKEFKGYFAKPYN